jgi:hypothetical protein
VRFATEITLTGPVRAPAQMLAEQSYDGHHSIHDGGTAASLGLAGAPIEAPTHFSQFDPLAVALWGEAWFVHGCISAHFRTMVMAGEEVQAALTTTSPNAARIEAHRSDGQPVLAGTVSLGPDHPETELEGRLGRQGDPGQLYVVDQLEVGARIAGEVPVTITHDEGNGPLYPFSLAQKVVQITEPHPWYTPDGGRSSPWGRAIVPFEMVSVLTNKAGRPFPVRAPSLGLFLDLEVRLLAGPIFVDQPYLVDREVVGLSQSRRTESYWTRSTVTDAESGTPVAVVLLHSGVFKESYPGYPTDLLA